MSAPTIRQLARWLRKEFPTTPVRVRCRSFGWDFKELGYTTHSGKAIHINNLAEEFVQRETLLHEWAHVRVGWKTDEPHTQEFWKELGRITNAYFHWREEVTPSTT